MSASAMSAPSVGLGQGGVIEHLATHPYSQPFPALPSSLAGLAHLPASLLAFVQSKHVSDFHFVVDETPLSSWPTVLAVVAAYLALIAATQRLVAWRGKPFKLNGLFLVHNAFLSLGSLALLAALVWHIGALMHRHGVWAVFCDAGDQFSSGRHYWYYYLNYLFKYVELADTILLALKGKPLLFLHVYHHAATLLLCFTQLRAQSCMQFVPIAINLAIHVLMYSYYAATTLKLTVWWKRYLTLAQIVQFVVGLTACVVGLGSLGLYVNGVGPELGGYKCHGEFSAAYFGIGILLSYLVLFIKFYFDSYREKQAARQAKAKKVE